MMATINLYSKEQIDEKQIGTPDDTASASGSLWSRIKNALSRIGVLETADTNNVKKTGTSTVTGTLEVPTTPPTPTSAVNSAYVNDATAGVNNIAHKSGKETLTETKDYTYYIKGRTFYGTGLRNMAVDDAGPSFKVIRIGANDQRVIKIEGTSRDDYFRLIMTVIGGSPSVREFIRTNATRKVYVATQGSYTYVLINAISNIGGTAMALDINVATPGQLGGGFADESDYTRTSGLICYDGIAEVTPATPTYDTVYEVTP